MAENQVYSGTPGDLPGGVLFMDRPDRVSPEPAVTPASRPDLQDVTTTADIQRSAEYIEQTEVQGGFTVVPFGPPVAEDSPGNWRVMPGLDGEMHRGFAIAESVGMMPLLRFAHAAKTGGDTDDMEGMAALYTMIRDVVHENDWEEFQEYATLIKAEDEELLAFISGAMEAISARKVQQRGSSSGTSPRTSVKSKGGSSRRASVIPPGSNAPAEVSGLMDVGDLVR